MSTYKGHTHYDHLTPTRTGVLLINLGTPAAPTATAVRRYLAEFLSDPRVIEYPRWAWLPILHGIILRFRPARSAHAYAQIWTNEGSPLWVHSNALSQKLQARLQAIPGTNVTVTLGMNYGEPSISQALHTLHANPVQRLVVLPLYPQYASSTTGATFDRLTRALQQWRWVPELHCLTHYHDDPQYIQAVADSITAHWQQHTRTHLLMSFHGLPKRYLLAGDPYYCHCMKTARLLAERLQLQSDEWSVGFQSRVGREAWLQPYTETLLQQYAQQGVKKITVACPGFAVDCLETLEEIAIRNRAQFLAQGGEQFDYIPALNDSDAQVAVLTRLLSPYLQSTSLTQDAYQATQHRARAMGATQ